ncbi:hypothetical protein CR513_59998, partial [Mucuna pruriens]
MKTLILNELLRALRIHEVHLQKREKFSSKDPLALKIRETSSRKEVKCLKAFKVETFNAQMIHPKDKNKKQSKEEKEVICFECKKLGHFKVDCPKLKKRWRYNKSKIGYDRKKDKSPIKRCSICNFIEDAEQACIPVRRFKRILKKFDPKEPRKILVPKSQIFSIANIFGRQRKDFTLVLGQWMLMTHDERRTISFEGSEKGKIVGIGKVETCIVKNKDLFIAQRHENLYKINLNELNNQILTCLISKDDERLIWHKKHGHINLKYISKLYKNHLVKGLLEISWKTHLLYNAY